MLTLSRKVGQSINLSGGISVKLVEIRGNQVRLGFTAPMECRIVRDELEGRLAQYAGAGAEVRKRLAAGERLCDIEAGLDKKENER